MYLTKCAVCATELGLSSGKKCGRCSTRYCGAACQEQHWREGGHDKLCKKIKKAGGAEQYNANMKYVEAVAVAVCSTATFVAARLSHDEQQQLQQQGQQYLAHLLALRSAWRRWSSWSYRCS